MCRVAEIYRDIVIKEPDTGMVIFLRPADAAYHPDSYCLGVIMYDQTTDEDIDMIPASFRTPESQKKIIERKRIEQ